MRNYRFCHFLLIMFLANNSFAESVIDLTSKDSSDQLALFSSPLGTSGLGAKAENVSVPCRDKNGKMSEVLVKLTREVVTAMTVSNKEERHKNCEGNIEGMGYDRSSCKTYRQCNESVFGISVGSFISTDIYQKKILPYLGKASAEVYTNQMIAKNLNQIEEYKNLRKFAEKLGVKLDGIDKCEEKNSNNSCSSADFEKNFLGVQKNCNEKSGFNCYKLEDKTYTTIETKGSQELKSDLYLDRLAETRALEAISNEVNNKNYNEIVKALQSNLMTKNKADEKKLKLSKVKEILASLDQDKKLDPFLSKIKNDDDSLLKLIDLTHSMKSKNEEVLNSLIKFRAEKLQEIFSGGNCEKIPTLRNICENKNKIASFEIANFSKIDESLAKDIFGNQDLDRFFNDIKQSDFNFFESKNEFSSLIKGYQCYFFVHQYGKKGQHIGEGGGAPRGNSKSDADDEENEDPLQENAISTANAQYISSTSGPDAAKRAIKADGNISISDIHPEETHKDLKANDFSVVNTKDADTKLADTTDLNKVMADSFNTNGASNSKINPSVNNNSYYNPNPVVPNDKKESDNNIGKSTNSELDQKLKELNDRLAATENSLKDAKVKEKEKDASISDGSKKNENDDLIKSLEAEVKNLKSELTNVKSKPVSDENGHKDIPPSTNVSDSSFNSAPSISVSNNNKASVEDNNHLNQVDRSIAPSSEIGKANQAAISNVSSATQGSVGIANSNISSVGGKTTYQGIVLTKVDGMSNEAVSETIYQKISESNGQPFMIEEGGFVKEIVPVMKDGVLVLDKDSKKPIYEKIVKGKVSEMREKEAKRALATVQNAADLKKAEDLKVKAELDRQKYEALKKLSQESVK